MPVGIIALEQEGQNIPSLKQDFLVGKMEFRLSKTRFKSGSPSINDEVGNFKEAEK